jgi:osmotically-inducible protein OsmY
MTTDLQLHTAVFTELMRDPHVTDKEIGLAVKDGVVTITGTVAGFDDKWVVESAVERVPGVKAVANALTVKIPGAPTRTDTEIAHQAVDALAWNIQVPDDKIRISVTYGWVTLEGEVQWSFERDAAGDTVRRLHGVRGVTNDIKLRSESALPEDMTCGIKEALQRRALRATEPV